MSQKRSRGAPDFGERPADAVSFHAGNIRSSTSDGPAPQLPLKVAVLQKNADEEVRVSLDEYRGHHLADIRVFAAWTATRTPMPTRKGVSLRIEQLPDLIEALKDAEQKARMMGLL